MSENNKDIEDGTRIYNLRRRKKIKRGKVDFFVSYSYMDKQWAEWIVDCIEKEGYTTFWRACGLVVEDNFMSVIQDQLEGAEKFIAVLSPAYFESVYCQAELTFSLQKEKSIIPVKVSKEVPTRDIEKFSCVDLYDVDKDDAKRCLIKAISNEKRIAVEFKRQKKADTRFPGEFPINNLKFSDITVVGGENKILAIREAFNHNSTVSSNLTLFGMGGVGKTTIAKKYIQVYGYLYDLIWWISAESEESIIHEYKRFAIEQKLIENDQIEKGAIVSIVKRWMSSTKKWLFVFDDVDEYTVIQSFIPPEHKGNILMISRDSLLKDSRIDEIKLDGLTTEQAKELLRIRGVSGRDEEIAELIQQIGHLPLILKNAADCIKRNKISISDFLQQSFSKSDELNSLDYFSNLASAYKEQGDYDSALECYFKVLELSKEEKSNEYTYFAIATIYQELGEFDRALELYSKVLYIQQSSLYNAVLVAKTYNNMATIYLQMQDFGRSQELYKKSFDILRIELGEEHPSVATALSNIASVYTTTGKYDEALIYNQEALSIRIKVLGEEHPDTASTYINIAENYLSMYKNSIALGYYEMGLGIYEKTLGTKHPVLFHIYKEIGDIYQELEDYESALEFYNKAMQIKPSLNHKKDNEFGYDTFDILSSSIESANVTKLSEENKLSPALKLLELKAKDVLSELGKQDSEDFKLFNMYYSELVSLVLFIQNELEFNYDGKVEICHYSKISTLKHIIKQKDCEVQPKFRISNIAYLNDPSEGNVLLQMLKMKVNEQNYNVLFGNVNEDEKLEQIPFSNVFIGSFSTAKNKLPMWTLYGDDSKGCCLVFDDYFFDEKNVLVEAKMNEEKVSRNYQDLTLYKVKYIDFDKLDKEEERDAIIDAIGNIADDLNDLEKVILKYESVQRWINDLLDMIRFLFKDVDYNYENEVRVIIHAEDAQIRLDDTQTVPRLFVEIQKKLEYKEIILGSKTEKPVEIAPFLLHSGMVKKVTKSGIHYQ